MNRKQQLTYLGIIKIYCSVSQSLLNKSQNIPQTKINLFVIIYINLKMNISSERVRET